MIACWTRALDRFLFENCHAATCALLRVGYGLLLIVYVVVWWIDGPLWFSSQGALSIESAEAILRPWQWSLFLNESATSGWIHVSLAILLVNAVLLTLGVYPRTQAFLILIWLVSFQNRNPLIADGEDNVFRLFAFFLIWCPLSEHASMSSWWSKEKIELRDKTPQAWGLRLFQVQMAIIYLSAAGCKSFGSTWWNGSAVYYVYQSVDYFGRGYLPPFLTETDWVIRLTTWGVLLLEAVLPLALFYPRTRQMAIGVGILLHLSMEYSMNLFLFQWIMILGLLSFSKPEDFRWLYRQVPGAARHAAVNAAS